MEEDKEESNDSSDHYGSLIKERMVILLDMNKLVWRVLRVALRLVVVIVILIVAFHGARGSYTFGKAIFMDEPITKTANARETTVTIPEGASSYKIGRILEEKKLIRDAKVFWVQSMCYEEGKTMKGGNYTLDTSMNAREMITIIGATDSKE